MNPEPCEMCGRRPPTEWTNNRLHVCMGCAVRIDEMREDHLQERMEANHDPE